MINMNLISFLFVCLCVCVSLYVCMDVWNPVFLAPFVEVAEFSAVYVWSSVKHHTNVVSCIHVWVIYFVPLSYLSVWRNGDHGQHHFTSGFNGITLNFSPLKIVLYLGLSYIAFIVFRKNLILYNTNPSIIRRFHLFSWSEQTKWLP